jgi:hypothetical protein
MNASTGGAAVGDRRHEIERLLADWRAAERELAEAEPATAEHRVALERAKAARAAYRDLVARQTA